MVKFFAALIRKPVEAVLRRTRSGGAVHTALYLAGFDVDRLTSQAGAGSEAPGSSPRDAG